MKTVQRTTQFKRDVKLMQKRGKQFQVFKQIIEDLVQGRELAAKQRDHVLVGQYHGSRECHVEPDWLLIYELTLTELILIRTVTHSDLFR